MSFKGLIISFISIAFLLPFSIWYMNLFASIDYFKTVAFGGYFLIGGLLALFLTVVYLLTKR